MIIRVPGLSVLTNRTPKEVVEKNKGESNAQYIFRLEKRVAELAKFCDEYEEELFELRKGC